MQPKRVQGILFDLDDTLIDRKGTFPVYAARFLQTFGPRLGEVDVQTVSEAILKADAGGYRPENERLQELVDELPWRGEKPSIEELKENWTTEFAASAVPMEGMFELLKELRSRGIRLGLITNGYVRRQNNKIDALGLRPYLDVVCVSGAVGIHKPDPRIFQHALAELQVDAAHAWYVGDHPTNDIIGGEGAGLTTVWRRGCHEWPTDRPEPKLQFDTLKEIIPMLDRFEAEGKERMD